MIRNRRLFRSWGAAFAVAMVGAPLMAAGDASWIAQRTIRPVMTAQRGTLPETTVKTLERRGQMFPGVVGIAVHQLGDKRTVGWNMDRLFPQQSVSKFWVALTVFDQIDQGKLTLQTPVLITPADLTLFNQPIRALVTPQGYRTTVADLLSRAMRMSDNTANDSLLRTVGGPEAVRAMMRRHDIRAVRFGPGERVKQSRTAGLTWQQSYSIGRNFEAARARVPYAQREAAFRAYLADPMDGAAPKGITDTLTRLWQGEILSNASTDALLTLMATSRTGAARLRAGLPPGWHLAHKTGTGQDFAGTVGGFNDIGLVVAPTGQVYAVAVMIGETRAPIAQRQKLIADVVRIIAGTSTESSTGTEQAPDPEE